MRRVLLVLTLIPALLAALYAAGPWHLPPRWDPAAPLDFREETNLLTGWKLARMSWQPETCFAAFEESGIAVERLPDRPSDTGCPLRDIVRLPADSLAFSPGRPFVTCPLAASWALFERYALQPAAARHFGSPVVRIRHLGSYACRNVYGRTAGRRSEHATANALDVAGFTLANGREISLRRDWGQGPAGAFLRDVRDGACASFKAVLGPDYNDAHQDHFHLDRGHWGRCS